MLNPARSYQLPQLQAQVSQVAQPAMNRAVGALFRKIPQPCARRQHGATWRPCGGQCADYHSC